MDRLYQEIDNRLITRLCHFTKSNKMLHILGSEDGIVANQFLDDDILTQNDLNRFDNHEDYISTSIEYPNMWYLNRIKDRDPLFKDWVILFFDPKIMIHEKTLFCHTNAAAARGAYLKHGYTGFAGMYNNPVVDKNVRYRTDQMLACSPTNDQGEVMIYRNIPRNKIFGMAVPSFENAKNEVERLKLCGINYPIKIIVAPTLFTTELSNYIRKGIRPEEMEYERT